MDPFVQHLTPVLPPDKIARRKQEVALKAVSRVFECWALTDQESADLFNVSIATWERMKAGKFRGQLGRDRLTRASLIIGTFKALNTVFHGPIQNGWPKHINTNPLFNGRTPLTVMIEGGIPAMFKVRNYVDAVAQGY